MLKLLKYELLRRKKVLIAFGITTFVLELMILNFVRLQDRSSIFSLLFLGLLAIGLIAWVFINTIENYYSDFKKNQGILLFLTPIKGQSLVLSKLIIALIQIVGATLIFGFCVWLANGVAVNAGYTGLINLISSCTGMDGLEISMMEFTDQIRPLQGQLPVRLLVGEGVLIMLLDFFSNIMIAFTAITIGRTLLSRNSLNWLYALLIYFGLTIVLQFITGAVVMPFILTDIYHLDAGAQVTLKVSEGFAFAQKIILIDGLISVFVIISGFFVSSVLINKKIDI